MHINFNNFPMSSASPCQVNFTSTFVDKMQVNLNCNLAEMWFVDFKNSVSNCITVEHTGWVIVFSYIISTVFDDWGLPISLTYRKQSNNACFNVTVQISLSSGQYLPFNWRKTLPF